jgi:hypothetical protein
MGVFLYHLLRRQKTDRQYDRIVDNYADKVEVSVPEHMVFNEGVINITSLTSIYFNTLIENELKRELFYHVHFHHNVFKYTQKDCIIHWMNLYGITDDDITVDGLWKALERIKDNGRSTIHPLFWKNYNNPEKNLPSDASPVPVEPERFYTHGRITRYARQ